jgi:hypothetical protein
MLEHQTKIRTNFTVGKLKTQHYLSIPIPITSLRCLNIAIPGISVYCNSKNIKYISEGFFPTGALRRHPVLKEKCPSLLGFRALSCSERGDRTLDLRVMNPTLLPTELPRHSSGFCLKVCKGNDLTFCCSLAFSCY